VVKVGGRRLVRNNRLQDARHVNQSCATACFIESMLPVGTPQNRFATVSLEERTHHTRAAMAESDPGCVKTLEVIVSAQQQNQICGPGESFMRRAALSLNQSCARTILRKVFTQPRPKGDIRAE